MKNTFWNKLFLIIFVFLLSLGQLQRIELSSGIAFYFHDLLIFIYLVFQQKIIIKKLKKNKIFSKKINLIFFIWIILGWTVAIFTKNLDFKAFLYFARLIVYLLFAVTFKENYKNEKRIYLLISKLILVIGFLQYFLLPDLRFIFYSGWDDHYYRLTSTILDPAFTAIIFVFAIINLIKNKNPWIILFSIGLLLTYSRAGYLSLIASLLLIFLIEKKNRKTMLTLLIVFMISIPFLPNESGGEGVNLARTYSIESRFQHDQEIIKSLKPVELILGKGLFSPNDQAESHANFADSWIVFLISNIGIGGLIILLTLFTREINKLIKNKESEKLALITALVTHGLFNNDLTQSFVNILFLGFYL